MRDNTITRREKLNMLQTEELDRMLQQELRKETPDEEVVLPILDVLRDRDTCTTVEIDDTASNAWEKFQNTQMITEEKLQNKERKTSFRRKIAVLAVAACLVVVIIPVAFGKEGFFSAVARWTKDFFSFSDFNKDAEDDTYIFKTDNPDLQQLYERTKELGIEERVVPTWLPSGFVLEEMKVSQTESGRKLIACFFNGDESIVFGTVEPRQNNVLFEKSDGTVETYEVQGIEHFITFNRDAVYAVWFSNNNEFYIITTLGRAELLQIINSIYKG